MNDETLVGTDFHIGHNNAAMLAERGMVGVKEHDESWFKFIRGKKDKELIFLGDLALCGKKRVNELLEILSVSFKSVIFIYGNHDRYVKKFARANATHNFCYSSWKNIDFMQELKLDIDKVRYTFKHFPEQVWDKQRYGGVLVHGHCHGALKTSAIDSPIQKAVDASIENTGRWALPLGEIKMIMENKKALNT